MSKNDAGYHKIEGMKKGPKTLEFDVAQDGSIVSIRDGSRSDGYVLAVSVGKPLWSIRTPGRWDAFDNAILSQQEDEWVVYSGFPNKEELRRAKNHVSNRFNRRRRLELGINVISVLNTDKLELAVFKRSLTKEELEKFKAYNKPGKRVF